MMVRHPTVNVHIIFISSAPISLSRAFASVIYCYLASDIYVFLRRSVERNRRSGLQPVHVCVVDYRERERAGQCIASVQRSVTYLFM